MKIAIAGAGIYGSTIAIDLSLSGHDVRLFDPKGPIAATSYINQFRVHRGYHYPSSPETIKEVCECWTSFIARFGEAIVQDTQNFYAVPKSGSRISAAAYRRILNQFNLPFTEERPDWMDFTFVDACFRVDERLYDPDLLRANIETDLERSGVTFVDAELSGSEATDFDAVIWATYGLGESARQFPDARIQVVEKVRCRLPEFLQSIALVLVDGPFTAFDTLGASGYSLFGSGKLSNIWTADASDDSPPRHLANRLYQPHYEAYSDTRFDAMAAHAALAAPAVREAEYAGSKYTLRSVMGPNRPETSSDIHRKRAGEQRTLEIRQASEKEWHVFSGKVVGAVKAAAFFKEHFAQ